jgi:ABC-type branched-subunit amino acid transport system substrate-binding protein
VKERIKARELSESKNPFWFERGDAMHLGYFAAACLSVAISGIDVSDAIAQDVVKIGVVIPMTGGFASVGREVAAGAKLYIQEHGEAVAGRKVNSLFGMMPASPMPVSDSHKS